MTIEEYVKQQNPTAPEPYDRWCDVKAGYADAFHDCKEIFWESVGDYSGDHYVIVERDGQYGFSVIGFGSCSGCDAMEGAQSDGDTWEEKLKGIIDLLEGVRNGVHWEPSREAMHKYLTEECDKEMKLTWVYDREEKKALWDKLVASVAGRSMD